MGDVRRAIAADHPLALLSLVSSLLAALDPRRRSPFERRDTPTETVTREQLVRTFSEVDEAETTALLAVIAVLSTDEVERVRLGRVLAARHHPLPAWITQLAATSAERTMEMVHVLRDGDNVYVDVRLPGGAPLTFVIYIDHNLGTLVKDAFVVPGPLADVIGFMRDETADPDVRWSDIEPADARVRITEAIELGAMTFPPLESDGWPGCRPLVEWVVRMLPSGGSGYERPEWSDAERHELTAKFFASPFARGLGHADFRSLFESLLWFGTDYGPGDPLRWSPVSVEMLLVDWLPRKIVADATYLSKAPKLLRAFVRFCHAERGIRSSLTEETLAAVDHWEPSYQRTIRSARPQGPAALLAALGVLDDDDELDDEDDDFDDDDGDDDVRSYTDIMLEVLREAVGGDEALTALDDLPLPDEPFEWLDIAEDIRAPVADVLAACDGCCDAMLDVEYRTACRRFLARASRDGPAVFRRKARAETAAAAVCWIVGKANDLFHPSRGGVLVKDLTAHFGLATSGVSPRAATLLKAAGFDGETFGQIRLGTPDLLVSSRRQRIIQGRNRLQPG